MLDEKAYLRVKIKSLAEEAKIIREEAKKVRSSSIKNGLYLHRIQVVRNEARHTLLAYGFLRGRTYQQLEPRCTKLVDWAKVRKMVAKYCIHDPGYVWGEWKKAQDDKRVILERFDKWVKDTKAELESKNE